MTGPDVKSARLALGLTQSQMAERLRLGPNGRRTVRRWEKDETPVPGPVQVAVESMIERMK